jgi:hypothetical protein
MGIFIEFLTGSGLALFFHWILNYKEAAYIMFGVGILLSIATQLLLAEIRTSREKLCDKYDKAHEITFSIAQIADSECKAKAQEIIAGAQKTIELLQKGYLPMDEAEYYLESAKLSDQAKQKIKSVDPMIHGWGTRGAHQNFYQANLRAQQRGLKLIRLFVVDHGELDNPDVQTVLLAHFKDNIEIRLAYRDELPDSSDSSGRNIIDSYHFAIYDDQVATEVFDKTGKYFGQKTVQPGEIAKYLHMYDLMEHGSHPIVLEDDRIVLPSVALSPLG